MILKELSSEGKIAYLIKPILKVLQEAGGQLERSEIKERIADLDDQIAEYAEIEQEKKLTMKPNEKHLEFLQNNIARMNKCSFQIKGWVITLASALIAVFVSTISKENPGNKIYIYAAIASTILFWCLDSLYLSKERKFIGVYNDLIGVTNGKNHKSIKIKVYEIPIKKYKEWKYSFVRAMLLPSEIILYGAIIIGLIVLTQTV